MNCLFCDSSKIKDSFLPSTQFAGKRFDYKECEDCGLHFISPIPNQEDLLKMYPPEYQNGVDHHLQKDIYKKIIGLRFSYGFQFDLLKRINFKGRMLDFGCGNANFLINANHHGFNCDGLEYNPKHVEILRKEIPSRNFHQFDEFFQSDEKYDLIRLSNVFEHFTDPKDSMKKIKEKLTPNGYLLLEGPIETNFNFALQFRKIFFKLRKLINKDFVAFHTPTHIVFTNRHNQLDFFEKMKMKTSYLKISEAEWPFPPSFKVAKGVVQKINAIIAKVSIQLNNLHKNWGNTFIYLGQRKD